MARNDHGHMVPNADFMRAYFMRDEVAPEDGSCPAELALHERLIDDPFTAVVPTDLFEIADKDVVHNYQAVLNFRNFLAGHPTLESAFMAMARDMPAKIPPLFSNKLRKSSFAIFLMEKLIQYKLERLKCCSVIRL